MAQSMSVPFRRQFSHLPWDLQLLLTLPYSLQVISLFFNFFFLLVYSCFTVLCWFLLCSKVHQPCVYTYPLFFGFLFCWGHHWALSRVPCSIQLSSVALSCLTLCDPMDCSTPGFPVLHQGWLSAGERVWCVCTHSRSLLKLMSIKSDHLILCCPLLLFPSIMVFSNESALHIRWPQYWSFSFSVSSSSEHPGLISSRMDWFDLLAVQGTLKSPFQHYSSKASILQCSAFFIVQLSHP